MKTFKEYILEVLSGTPAAARTNYLANVAKGKPVGRRDKPLGRIPSRLSRFAKLPIGIRRILGTNI